MRPASTPTLWAGCPRVPREDAPEASAGLPKRPPTSPLSTTAAPGLCAETEAARRTFSAQL